MSHEPQETPTCRFCGQWNPPGALRCAFCQNARDADQDRTAAGSVRMSVEQLAAIPRAERSMFDQPQKSGMPRLELSGIPRWALQVGGVVIVSLVLVLLRFCR